MIILGVQVNRSKPSQDSDLIPIHINHQKVKIMRDFLIDQGFIQGNYRRKM